MAALGQSIVVLNKSGKAMKTSKHLVNVFKEAKSAYLEKKAELRGTRSEDPNRRRPSKSASPPHREASRRDRRSPTRDRRSPPRDSDRRRSSHAQRSDSERRRHRSSIERVYSDSDVGRSARHENSLRPSSLRPSDSLQDESPNLEVARRHSYEVANHAPQNLTDDSGLAYGEMPPPLPTRPGGDEAELKAKMGAVSRMLEEANCVRHSATAVIKQLEGNPDAMAAVALTLAEISNIVRKVGPGALLSLRTAFPTVVALLVSPEFLIAAGVGVGVTVVALGGYRVVKKIKSKKATEKETSDEEAAESLQEVSRIEHWRRGVSDVEAASVGTSVEGELITPGAAKQLAVREKEDKRDHEKQKKDRERTRKDDDTRSKAEKRDRKERDKPTETPSLSIKDARRDRERREKDTRRESGLKEREAALEDRERALREKEAALAQRERRLHESGSVEPPSGGLLGPPPSNVQPPE